MELIALASSGKGTWGQISGLINKQKWDKIILICPDFFKQNLQSFDFTQKAEIFSFNFDKPIAQLILEIRDKLKTKIDGTEVALSIASGDGREHMILISSILQVPAGIKFVALTKDGILEF